MGANRKGLLGDVAKGQSAWRRVGGEEKFFSIMGYKGDPGGRKGREGLGGYRGGRGGILAFESAL